MMTLIKKVLIIKNIEREGPGLIASWFDIQNVDYDIIEINQDLHFNDFLEKYDGLVVLGGPSSANDKTFVMQKQIEFITCWLKTKKPYLGVCLGMQLMIKASGGEVFQNKEREIGFFHKENLDAPYKIHLTNLENNPLKEILPLEFDVFQLHGETVSHPKILSLAESAYCKYQICSAGDKQIGLQFHFEISEGMLRNWIINDDFLVFANKELYINWYRERQVRFENKCFSIMRYIFS